MKRALFSVILILAVLLGSLLTSPPVAQAQTYQKPCYVDDTATGLNDGSSWQNAYKDLQTPLQNPSNCEAILVAEGTYYPSASDRTVSFKLYNNLIIAGGFPNGGGKANASIYKTFLSGDIGKQGDATDNSYHVVTGLGLDSTAVLDGFRITGGYAENLTITNADRGGGLYLENSSPLLRNLVITANAAISGGGGAYLLNSSPTFFGVVISNNNNASNWTFGTNGGGLWTEGTSNPILNKVQINNNFAARTGGGFYSNGNPTMTDVAFNNNTAVADGGGMYSKGNASLTRITFNNNTSGSYAGALYVGTGSLTARSCNFTNNNSGTGGGVSVFSSIVIISSLIDQNNAPRGGGGLYIAQGASSTLVSVKVTRNHSVGTDEGSGWGGGILSYASSARFYNLLLNNNYSTSCSALANVGTAQFVNATIAGNHAKTALSAVCFDAASVSTQLVNSVIWGNTDTFPAASISIVPELGKAIGSAQAAAEPAADSAGTINISYSILQDGCPTGATCANLVTGDPLFIDLTKDNCHLKRISPAVNAGNTGALPADTYDLDGDGNTTEVLPYDLDGGARVMKGKVDLGAFEGMITLFIPFLRR